MKRNPKSLVTMLALCLFLLGLITSFSSFKVDQIFLTDTGTGTGTGGGGIENAVLVSGIDCSWKEAVYNPDSGIIIGYNVFTASYSECMPGSKTCKQSDQKPCIVTNITFEKSK